MQSLLFITITGGLEILAFISTEKRVYMVFYSVDAYFVWQKVSPNIKFSRVPGMVKFLLCWSIGIRPPQYSLQSQIKLMFVNGSLRSIHTQQCWSKSRLVSPAVSLSLQGQSLSPSGQSPSPLGVSPSPLNQRSSPSPSPLNQIESESESESNKSQSESSPDLIPDLAWTHESNSWKVLYLNPTFNNFCWMALYID